ncbi:MAG: hypothetical protein HZB99_04105 [Candidatus Harrisonbacteria bacterium]|nr:hypothetical protein [Candidatus Harrisonbacteria bacterium]
MEINSVSLVYIFTHLGKRILGFFGHWYINGFLRIVHWTYNILEKLDRYFALRITMKNWFQPLYQDYTPIGYLWGFTFRTVRILISLIVYAVIIFLSASVYILWAAVPIYVIYKIFTNL